MVDFHRAGNDMNTDAKTLLLYIRVGVAVLTARLVLLLAMALTFGLFAWAMYLPGYERIAAATIFAILVFIPATRVDAAQSTSRDVISPKGES
jgi:hypothetical protein